MAPYRTNRQPLRVRARAIKQSLAKLVTQRYAEILLFFTALFFLRSAIGRALPDHFYYSVQWLYLLLAFMLINYAFAASRKNYRSALIFIALLLFGSLSLNYAIQVKRINIGQDTFPIHVPDKDL